MAGAVGIEPTTRGFGVAQSTKNPQKSTDFKPCFEPSRVMVLPFDALLMLFHTIPKHLIFGASNFFARYQQLIRINKEK